MSPQPLSKHLLLSPEAAISAKGQGKVGNLKARGHTSEGAEGPSGPPTKVKEGGAAAVAAPAKAQGQQTSKQQRKEQQQQQQQERRTEAVKRKGEDQQGQVRANEVENGSKKSKQVGKQQHQQQQGQGEDVEANERKQKSKKQRQEQGQEQDDGVAEGSEKGKQLAGKQASKQQQQQQGRGSKQDVSSSKGMKKRELEGDAQEGAQEKKKKIKVSRWLDRAGVPNRRSFDDALVCRCFRRMCLMLSLKGVQTESLASGLSRKGRTVFLVEDAHNWGECMVSFVIGWDRGTFSLSSCSWVWSTSSKNYCRHLAMKEEELNHVGGEKHFPHHIIRKRSHLSTGCRITPPLLKSKQKDQ